MRWRCRNLPGFSAKTGIFNKELGTRLVLLRNIIGSLNGRVETALVVIIEGEKELGVLSVMETNVTTKPT